jgi:hypothetical protein
VIGDYLEPGQTTGDAPGILGDWVVMQVNGLPTKTASSIVAINQHDPKKITRVYPFGTDLPTGASWAPPKAAVDPENDMVVSADQDMEKIGGVHLDRATGEMTTVWTLDAARHSMAPRTVGFSGRHGPHQGRRWRSSTRTSHPPTSSRHCGSKPRPAKASPNPTSSSR